MRFTFLSGDSNWRKYGGKFISPRLNNGEFDYWLVLDFTNMREATGDENQHKYAVTIQAVSPQAAGQANLDKSFAACGFSEDIDLSDPVLQIEALSDYGLFACLWTETGDNARALLKAARAEADKIEILFGFYMDRPENGIGQNGWSLIAGQDIREFFAAR